MRKDVVITYFVWFSLLRIFIAFNMAFKDVITADVLVAIFFTLMMSSVFINLRYRIFDTWYKHLANVALEFALLGLAIAINVTEWFKVSEERSNQIGARIVMVFTCVQMFVMAICTLETIVHLTIKLIKLCKYLKRRLDQK